jgi:hypothetical protein
MPKPGTGKGFFEIAELIFYDDGSHLFYAVWHCRCDQISQALRVLPIQHP